MNRSKSYFLFSLFGALIISGVLLVGFVGNVSAQVAAPAIPVGVVPVPPSTCGTAPLLISAGSCTTTDGCSGDKYTVACQSFQGVDPGGTVCLSETGDSCGADQTPLPVSAPSCSLGGPSSVSASTAFNVTLSATGSLNALCSQWKDDSVYDRVRLPDNSFLINAGTVSGGACAVSGLPNPAGGILWGGVHKNSGDQPSFVTVYATGPGGTNTCTSPTISVIAAPTLGSFSVTAVEPQPSTATQCPEPTDIKITWAASSNATSYEVLHCINQGCDESGGTMEVVGTVTAPTTSFTHISASAGAFHNYKIRAKDAAGNTKLSDNAKGVSPHLCAVTAQALCNGNGSAYNKLFWSPTSYGTTGAGTSVSSFDIKYCTGSSSCTPSTIAVSGLGTTALNYPHGYDGDIFVDGTLPLNTLYRYQVTAYSSGIATPLNIAQITTSSSCAGSSYLLTVTKAGTGSGTVTSSDGKINCGSDCSESYTSGATVTLTATPLSGSTFGGWSGACTGTATICTVTMTAAKTATATFNAVAPSTGTVEIHGIVDDVEIPFSVSYTVNGPTTKTGSAVPATFSAMTVGGYSLSNITSTYLFDTWDCDPGDCVLDAGSTLFLRMRFHTTLSPSCDDNAVGSNQFIGCLWDGTNFTTLDGAAPVGSSLSSPVSDSATALDYNWGSSSPDATAVGNDTYSAKWKGNFTFKAGTYTFTAGSDDGIRLKIDGQMIIDKWIGRAYGEDSATFPFSTQRTALVELEYFEDSGQARVNMRWTYAPPQVVTIPTPTISNLRCESNASKATINWTNVPGKSGSGYWVDISTNSSFSPFWNKNISNPNTISTTAPDGFGGLPVLTGGTTYYVRVYYIQSSEHSPTINFVAQSCESPPSIPPPASDASCPSGQSFGNTQSLGGAASNEPIVENTGNRLIIVVRGLDNQVWVKERRDDGSFKEWYSLAGHTPARPKIVEESGTLRIYVQGLDGFIYKNQYNSEGNWGGWQGTGVANASFGSAGPSAVATASAGTFKVSGTGPINLQACVSIGSVCGNGTIESGEQCEPPNTSTCSATCQTISGVGGPPICDGTWRPIEPAAHGKSIVGVFVPPGKDTQAANSIATVARGDNDCLYYNWHQFSSNTWTGWQPVYPGAHGCGVTSAPHSYVGSALDIQVTGGDGNFWHTINWGSGWQTWFTDASAAPYGTPTSIDCSAQGCVGNTWQFRAAGNLEYQCGSSGGDPSPITGSCAASPDPVGINAGTVWSVFPSGGSPPYTYLWSGSDGLSSTSATVGWVYSTTDSKTAEVVVTDSQGSARLILCDPLQVNAGQPPGDGGGDPPPPPVCSDDCFPSGATQCVGSGAQQTCGNFDTSDPCFEWGSPESCSPGESCVEDSCVSVPPSPVDAFGASAGLACNLMDFFWIDGQGDINNYVISCNGATIATVPGTARSHTWDGAEGNTSYTCTITAVRNGLSSTATPASPPSATTTKCPDFGLVNLDHDGSGDSLAVTLTTAGTPKDTNTIVIRITNAGTTFTGDVELSVPASSVTLTTTNGQQATFPITPHFGDTTLSVGEETTLYVTVSGTQSPDTYDGFVNIRGFAQSLNVSHTLAVPLKVEVKSPGYQEI